MTVTFILPSSSVSFGIVVLISERGIIQTHELLKRTQFFYEKTQHTIFQGKPLFSRSKTTRKQQLDGEK